MFPLSLSRPITFFDLETTSNIPSQARIVEIAIVQLKPDGERTEWWSLVNPGVAIPKAASDIHGILDEHVVDKPRFEELAPKLIRAFRGVDFGGYNVRYDLEVIGGEFKRVGVSTEVEGQAPPQILDGLRLWQLMAPRTLADAVKEFTGDVHGDSHNAKGDIDATIKVIEAQLLRFPEHRTLDTLHALQFPRPEGALDRAGKVVATPDGPALTFGKHKMLPLDKVPPDYIRWLLKTDLPADVRKVIQEGLRR